MCISSSCKFNINRIIEEGFVWLSTVKSIYNTYSSIRMEAHVPMSCAVFFSYLFGFTVIVVSNEGLE